MGKIRKRAGFTLIEVIVALGIFLILILALVGSYYSYYNSVKDLRYKSIGQNLAQLQLEDIQNLSVTVLDTLVKNGQFPSTIYTTAPNYPPDTNHHEYIDPGNGEHVEDIYDSGKIDGSYRIEHIVEVCVHDASGNLVCSDNSTGTLPDLLLPSSILVQKVLQIPSPPDSYYYDYTIILNKEVYPHYQKEIVITDRTPTITDLNNKIYEIQVTVYWTNKNGVTKSITITGEKSHARES
jgi:prepilin-type N-terminal cleavage/methylation domain-containing protein